MHQQPTIATTQVCAAAGTAARQRAGWQAAAGLAGGVRGRALDVFTDDRYGMGKPSHTTVRPRGLLGGGTG